LQVAGCELRVAGCELRGYSIADCGLNGIEQSAWGRGQGIERTAQWHSTFGTRRSVHSNRIKVLGGGYKFQGLTSGAESSAKRMVPIAKRSEIETSAPAKHLAHCAISQTNIYRLPHSKFPLSFLFRIPHSEFRIHVPVFILSSDFRIPTSEFNNLSSALCVPRRLVGS
jgi:hypothetical protein